MGGGILLAYVCGLLFSPLLNVSIGAILLFCLLLLPVWFSVRHRRVAALIVATFFFGAGICHYQLRLDPPHSPAHIGAWASADEVTVQGRVLDIVSKATGNSRVDLRVQAVGPMRGMREASGKVRLYVAEGLLPFQVGQTVRFRSRLRRPRLFGIPGEFDHPRHLALYDIYVTAFVKQAAEIVPFVSAHGETGPLQRLRLSARGLIVESIPANQAPLVAALVLGEKAGIPAEERDLLARGGISHLFSISGFHLGLVASLFYGCALLLYCRFEGMLLWQVPRRILPLALVPPIYGYVLLTGSSLPTLRAFLFVFAGALLAALSRRTRPLKLLTAAALVILLWQPLALFQPSFQLSFAGVAGILVAWPPFRTMSRTWPSWLRMPAGLLLTTLAATTATAPFVLWHFRMLAPAGLLLNLAAVPLVGFVALPAGLVGLLLTPVWPSLAVPCFKLCAAVLSWVLKLASWVLSFSFFAGSKLFLSPLQCLGLSLLLFCLLLAFSSRIFRRPLAFALAGLGLLLLLWRPSAGPALTLLSVGQGEACLLTMADGRNYLIDGGGLRSDRFDVGERLLAPALAHMGVRSLEAVILTHRHPDHSKGLPFLLRHFPVASFWSDCPLSELPAELRLALEESGVPVVRPSPGWTRLAGTQSETLRLFASQREGASENDRSLVLYYLLGEKGVLLTGDLEEAGVRNFLQHSPPEQVAVLKLPHHGSRHSQTGRLLDRYHPEVCLASVGRGNRYGLPAETVVEDLARRDIPLWRTDRDGSVRISLASDGLSVKQWKKGLFR